jgi:hypothetical protein
VMLNGVSSDKVEQLRDLISMGLIYFRTGFLLFTLIKNDCDWFFIYIFPMSLFRTCIYIIRNVVDLQLRKANVLRGIEIVNYL